MKNWKPLIIENSKIPIVLSKFAPIEINAISLFPFVFCRGKMSESTRRHETIHFQQQLETFIVFFYLIYLWDYLKAKMKGSSGRNSYLEIRAEKEAYSNEMNEDYLSTRERYKWLKK